jgi:hypothetical protein
MRAPFFGLAKLTVPGPNTDRENYNADIVITLMVHLIC